MEDQYIVFSYLGKKPFVFNDEKKAFQFFEDFIGRAILIYKNQQVCAKDQISTFPELVHASLFLQHGITRNGTNIIIDKFKAPPSEHTISNYQVALERFKDPAKGLALFGESGIGKTTMMRFFNMAVEARYVEGQTFDKVSVKDIIAFFKREEYKVYDEYMLSGNHGKNICIDDLGRDKGMRMQYGDKINIVGDIIESRYDSFIDHGLITHFTSNYDDTELQKLYDEKDRPVIWGRIREMAHIIVIEDQNFRLL